LSPTLELDAGDRPATEVDPADRPPHDLILRARRVDWITIRLRQPNEMTIAAQLPALKIAMYAPKPRSHGRNPPKAELTDVGASGALKVNLDDIRQPATSSSPPIVRPM
jgi:hypothetical protein